MTSTVPSGKPSQCQPAPIASLRSAGICSWRIGGSSANMASARHLHLNGSRPCSVGDFHRTRVSSVLALCGERISTGRRTQNFWASGGSPPCRGAADPLRVLSGGSAAAAEAEQWSRPPGAFRSQARRGAGLRRADRARQLAQCAARAARLGLPDGRRAARRPRLRLVPRAREGRG